MYFRNPVAATPLVGGDPVAIVIYTTIPAGETVVTGPDDSDGHTTDTEDDKKKLLDSDSDDEEYDDEDKSEESDEEEMLEESNDDEREQTTASGRVSRQPVRFQDGLNSVNAALDEPFGLDKDTKTQEWLREIAAAAITADRYEPTLTQAERHYYDTMAELEPEQYGCNPQE
jgi:hypothetical protein